VAISCWEVVVVKLDSGFINLASQPKIKRAMVIGIGALTFKHIGKTMIARAKTLIFFAMVVQLAYSSPARCSTVAFDKYAKAAQDAVSDRAVASENWKHAVAEAEKEPTDPARLAYALVHFGDTLTGKDNAASIRAYKRAISVRDQARLTETLGMARNLERLGILEMAVKPQPKEEATPPNPPIVSTRDACPEAEIHLQRALQIADKVGADEGFKLLIMRSLGGAYVLNKEYDSAKKLSDRLFELADKSQDPEAAREMKVDAYNLLSTIYIDQQMEDEEEAVRQKMVPLLPHEHPSEEQIKAKQDMFLKLEEQIDQSEQQDFR
jgi:tetratricopeptide (TPR) repeat protein